MKLTDEYNDKIKELFKNYTINDRNLGVARFLLL